MPIKIQKKFSYKNIVPVTFSSNDHDAIFINMKWVPRPTWCKWSWKMNIQVLYAFMRHCKEITRRFQLRVEVREFMYYARHWTHTLLVPSTWITVTIGSCNAYFWNSHISQSAWWVFWSNLTIINKTELSYLSGTLKNTFIFAWNSFMYKIASHELILPWRLYMSTLWYKITILQI